jgi:hypothetical protein
MIRATGRAGLTTTIAALLITAIATLVAIAPASARAQGAAWGDEDEKSRLVVMADFNRDGIPDMAEVMAGEGSGDGTLRVSLGEASGGFALASSMLAPGRTPRAIVAGDFNGDGIPDVIVGDDDGTLRLFLGDGTGKLVPGGEIARLDSVVSIAVADFDRDGMADIAVSDWRDGAVTILLGAGKGTFRRGWSFHLRMPAMVARVSAADFNGDGNPDLAVVYGDEDGYTFDVMLGDGKGWFIRSPELSFTRDPNSHCPA